ncbi:hypothetical protein [Streptomyces sp. NPDC001717]|uniref:hypothetical protein n=1 Tax=Streptomyces sp. NPDC001717 TaxID=3364604 RepID=UPI0036C3170B
MTTLTALDERLDSEETAVVLAAVWDVFGLTVELCDRIAFDEGVDEFQALLAGQKADAGRDLLPLPELGEPVTAPSAPGTTGLEPYVRMLTHAGESLERLLATADSVGEGAERVLSEAVELARGAAVALTRVRSGDVK